jgi:hypothetical protein
VVAFIVVCTWWLATFVKELLLRGFARVPHR